MANSVTLKCKCGEKTSTAEWKDIPDTCSVCKDQLKVKATLARVKD